jgi:hypothetical protein
MQVATHQVLSAAIAACGDLGEQPGGVGAALVPSLAQVGLERLQDAGPVPGFIAGQQFLDGLGAGEAADRAARQVESSTDLLDCGAIGQ